MKTPFTKVTLDTYSPTLEGVFVLLVTGLLIGVSESIAKTTPLAVVDSDPDEFVKVPETLTPVLLPLAVNEFI